MRCAARIFDRRPAKRPAAAAMIVVLLFAVAASIHSASAQTARTVRVVVSVPAGGAIDALVRVLADEIARTTGQPIVIDSRPGAGGVIAAERWRAPRQTAIRCLSTPRAC